MRFINAFFSGAIIIGWCNVEALAPKVAWSRASLIASRNAIGSVVRSNWEGYLVRTSSFA